MVGICRNVLPRGVPMRRAQMAQVFSYLLPIVFHAVAARVLMGAQNESFGIYGTLMTPVGMAPCAQCPIQLEAATGTNERSTLSNVLGNFYFNDLKDGVYILR